MPGDITEHLRRLALGGDPDANALLALVYDELRRMAAARMAAEQPGQTLQPTALVHEAYLRLAGDQQFENRAHFFTAAAEAMRRILVENARRKLADRRGGGAERIALSDHHLRIDDDRGVDVLALHEAMERLEARDLQAAALVKLRFFAGLGHQEAAEILGLSRRAADRLWLLARTWLFRALSQGH